MIKVVYNKDFKNLKITGHAGYADKGKDIVCASASSIILSSINLALEFNKGVKYTDDLNKIEIINNTNDENVTKVFSNMITCLEDLEKQYPDNIKISKGE
ncbi:MAG: ribosomal-processing cysteine protease Prp [Bacilli bacterium]|nr:ribosomal-processing cysteine protease Prp [Bacilli bacterium]